VSRAGGRVFSRVDEEDATGAGACVGSSTRTPAFSFFLCLSPFRWAS